MKLNCVFYLEALRKFMMTWTHHSLPAGTLSHQHTHTHTSTNSDRKCLIPALYQLIWYWWLFFSLPPSKSKPAKPEAKTDDPKKQKKFEKEEKEFRKKFKVLCTLCLKTPNYQTVLIRIVITLHSAVCCLGLGTYVSLRSAVLLKPRVDWLKRFHGPTVWFKRSDMSSDPHTQL